MGNGGDTGLNTNMPGNSGGGPADADPTNAKITHPTCKLACKDFPTAPIMGDGVPMNAAELFGDADNVTTGSALCVLEPQLSAGSKPGAMLPANWVRPRFRVAAPADIDLLEIRIHSPVEANDLVAYTKYVPAAGVAPSWYLPKEIWAGTPSGRSIDESAFRKRLRQQRRRSTRHGHHPRHQLEITRQADWRFR